MAEMTARLDHVGLAVADLGAAAAWYCDVFGLGRSCPCGSTRST